MTLRAKVVVGLGLAFVVAVASGCSGGGGTAPSPTIPPGAPNVAAGPTVSINAGGQDAGGFWADQFFSGGATYSTRATIDVSQIASPPPAAIFSTERYGAMTYAIPDRAGAQTVTLYFAEVYVTGPGQRLFTVKINGTAVLSDLDIYASAGGSNRAIQRTFTTAANSSGQVVIEFVPGVENPKINGITVAGAGTTPTPPPATPTAPPAAPPTNSADAKASAGCDKPRSLENGRITVQSNGTRSYLLRVPDNYDGHHPYRLVLAYHWAGGTAEDVADGTGATGAPFYGLWDLAGNSTIFVAPEGLGSGNNTGWANPNGEDVAFTDAIVAQLEAGLCVDTSRVFANGFSYGAGMSYALACARPDVFRAVALYSGSELSGCAGGTTPVAFYASHGGSDSVLDISRGRSLRDHFVEVNGLTAQTPPEPAVGSGAHVCTTYKGGSARYPVEWCAFDGDHNPNPHDGGQSSSWNPAQVWTFISQF